MTDPHVLDVLQRYISERVLNDPNAAIDADTPLLELGILNSLSTMQLVSYIRETFGTYVPAEEMIGENFKDLRGISELVTNLRNAEGARNV